MLFAIIFTLILGGAIIFGAIIEHLGPAEPTPYQMSVRVEDLPFNFKAVISNELNSVRTGKSKVNYSINGSTVTIEISTEQEGIVLTTTKSVCYFDKIKEWRNKPFTPDLTPSELNKKLRADVNKLANTMILMNPYNLSRALREADREIERGGYCQQV